MKIRQAHLDAFSPLVEETFVKRLLAQVAKKRGDVPSDQVRDALARGRRYGLTWESSLTAFVALSFEIAPDFDEHPPIQRVLKDGSALPDARIGLLLEKVFDADWDQAAARRGSAPAARSAETETGGMVSVRTTARGTMAIRVEAAVNWARRMAPDRPPSACVPFEPTAGGFPARPPAPRQSSSDLDTLFQAADLADVLLVKATREIADVTQGNAVVPGALKPREEAKRQIENDFGGDASRITDFSSTSIEYRKVDDLFRGLDRFELGYQTVQLKDRFAVPTPAGYREVAVVLPMANDHLVTIRLHLQAILAVKSGAGGPLFEEALAIAGSADLAANDLRRISEIRTQCRRLYGTAVAAPPGPDEALELPEWWIVGNRPVTIAPTRGGARIVAYDWRTGDLTPAPAKLAARVLVPTDTEADRVTEEQLDAHLAALRALRK